MSRLPELKSNSGQALLLVVLSLAIVLTIILSILSRSVTDIAVTSRSEEALRAFSAAEAGVEQALIIGSNTSGLIGDSNYTAAVSGYAEGANSFNYPISISSGESALFWFVAHDSTTGDVDCGPEHQCFTGSQLKICWGESGSSAIEASIYYLNTPGSLGTIRIARATYDPNGTRRSINNFAAPDSSGSCVIDGKTYQNWKTISFADLGIPAGVYSVENGLQYVKLRLFYNDIAQPVGIDVNLGGSGNTTLPSQGLKIESSGSAGGANRKIDVFQGYAETPLIFDSAVFSPGGLTK